MKKGSPSNSLPKTFCHFTQPYPHYAICFYVGKDFIQSGDMAEKNSKKSLERGLGKNLSSERFAPVTEVDFIVLYF